MTTSNKNTSTFAKKKPLTKGKGKSKKKKKKLTLFGKIFFTVIILSVIFLLTWGAFKFFNNNKEEDNDRKTEKTEVVKKEVVKKEDKKVKKEENKDKEESKDKKEDKVKEEKKEEPVKKKEEKKKEQEKPKETKHVTEHVNDKTNIKASINGFWMSTSEGAVLTMDNNTYRIDFAGIDASSPIIGTYEIQNKKITFTTEEGTCKGETGTYRIILEKHDIKFTCEDDNCLKRKATLTTEWEWLED